MTQLAIKSTLSPSIEKPFALWRQMASEATSIHNPAIDNPDPMQVWSLCAIHI